MVTAKNTAQDKLIAALRADVDALRAKSTAHDLALADHDNRLLDLEHPEPPVIEPVPTTVPFGSRPLSGPIVVGANDTIIENRTFRGLGPGVIAIALNGRQRVTIRNCDFIDVAEGVYAYQSQGIRIEDCRYSNITGPAQPRTGANVANFVQLNACRDVVIARNKGKGGDTEDIVSVYASRDCIVEDNHFEGTNWTSGSGSGIALGDAAGSGNIARRNKLLTPGQVGIFIAGGTNSRIEDNVIIREQSVGVTASGDVGIYVWKNGGNPDAACSGHTVARNKVRWVKKNGTVSPFWNGGNCGAIAGLDTNDFGGAATAAEIAALRVVL